jgi:hypothetical protein
MLIKQLHRKHLNTGSVIQEAITASKKTKLKCSLVQPSSKNHRLPIKNCPPTKYQEAMKKSPPKCTDPSSKRTEMMRIQSVRNQLEFQHKLSPFSKIISTMRHPSTTTLIKRYRCKQLKYLLISSRWASQSCPSRKFRSKWIRVFTLDPVPSPVSETSMSK